MINLFGKRIRDGDITEESKVSDIPSITKSEERRRRGMDDPKQAEMINGITGTEISEEGIGIIRLSGKIDQSNSEDILASMLQMITRENIHTFIFDMKDVVYVSRAGLVMFSTANIKAGEYEKAYKLIQLRADIMKVFQMMGYSAAFSIEANEEDA